MMSVEGENIPSVILVLLGIVILVNGLLFVPQVGQVEYHHNLSETSENEIPENANIIKFSELSPQTKELISNLIQSKDNSIIIYGEENKPPEFSYSDSAEVNEGIYYIGYNESYYILTTNSPPSSTQWVDFVKMGFYLLAGTGVILLGIFAIRQKRDRLSVSVLISLILLLVILRFGLISTSNTQLYMVVIAFAVLFPGVITFYVTKKLNYGRY